MNQVNRAEYCFEEEALRIGDASNEVASTIFSKLADILFSARNEGSEIYCSEAIWSLVVSSDRNVSDFLFQPGIDRDVRYRLSGLLQKCLNWSAEDPEREQPHSNSESRVKASRAVHECANRIRNAIPSAVISVDSSSGGGSAQTPISDPGTGLHLFSISDVQHFKFFWRSVPAACRTPITSVEAVADRAFPSLRFVEGVWNGVKDFDGDGSALRDTLIAHLSGLDDHFLEVYAQTNDANHIAIEMGSRAGIDCSKESNKTRRNGKAMAMRVRSVGAERVTFEWHTKFERDKNRIHFAVHRAELHIGIFCRHLDI